MLYYLWVQMFALAVIILGFFVGYGLTRAFLRKRGPKKHHTTENCLQVTGRSEVEFFLSCHPKRVHVCFRDEQTTGTCNPGHSDIVEWELDELFGESLLRIKWDVAGTRLICWEIQY